MISGLRRSLGEEKDYYPLQYSGLENFMDGGVWQATVHGVTESEMTEKGHAEALQGKPLHVQSLSHVRLL